MCRIEDQQSLGSHELTDLLSQSSESLLLSRCYSERQRQVSKCSEEGEGNKTQGTLCTCQPEGPELGGDAKSPAHLSHYPPLRQIELPAHPALCVDATTPWSLLFPLFVESLLFLSYKPARYNKAGPWTWGDFIYLFTIYGWGG